MKILINMGWSFLIMFAYGAIKIASIGSDQHAHTASIIVMIDTIPINIYFLFS